jgi:hypothetical protein
MNIQQKLIQYRDMKTELQPAINKMKALFDEICEELRTTQEQIDIEGVVVKYSSRRRFDWHGIATALKPSNEVIVAHTQTKKTVNWRGVCNDVGYSATMKDEFTKEGTVHVSVSVDTAVKDGE